MWCIYHKVIKCPYFSKEALEYILPENYFFMTLISKYHNLIFKSQDFRQSSNNPE